MLAVMKVVDKIESGNKQKGNVNVLGVFILYIFKRFFQQKNLIKAHSTGFWYQ